MKKPSITNPCPECFGTRWHLSTCSLKHTAAPAAAPKPKARGIGPKRREWTRGEIEQAHTELVAAGILPPPPPPVQVMPDPLSEVEIEAFTIYHRERGAICPSCAEEAFWQSATIMSTDRAWMTIHADDCRLIKFGPPKEAGNE
jgi:hypothetical protein